MDFLSQLNPSQRDAVTHVDGPSLVIAGAGSGKTRVLTYKIAYLLQQGIHAGNILALTFTNKAAREMRERISRLVSPDAVRYLWMGTFHSICARILRVEADRLGYTRDFSIYDTTDSKSLVKRIVREMQLDDKVYKPTAVLSRISMAKNAMISPSQYALDRDITSHDRACRMYQMPDVYAAYQQQLRAANAMDFDDLLLQMLVLLRQFPEVREKYQQAFQYILVDEYQDTNHVQYQLVRVLGEPQNNVCVVGDDAQSIYSFRGANIRNILDFQRQYDGVKLYKLERNYRSTQNIVGAANSLICKNVDQIQKQVYSENAEGSCLEVQSYMTDLEEARGVAKSIAESHAVRGTSLDDIAILYRTNAQSRPFENELRERGLNYRIYGGTSFFQRKEIKDAVSCFRIIINALDNEALIRTIDVAGKGIGATTMQKVREQASVHGVGMLAVMASPAEYQLPVSAGVAKKLVAFSSVLAELADQAEVLNAYDFALLALRQLGIMTATALATDSEELDRLQNLDELLKYIHEFVDKRTQEQQIDFTPITDFLSEVSLLTDQDQSGTDDMPRVTLMTVHAAKGLEFPEVYIVGLEENLFPSQMCSTPSEIEEERRLLYVAITRAMRDCHLTYARQRFRNGQQQVTSPSHFLNDIDRRYVHVMAPQQPAYKPQWRNSSWGDDFDTPSFGAPSFAAPAAPRRMTPLSSLPKSTSAKVQSDLHEGDRVTHRVFGAGTVSRVYRDNGADKIDIVFDDKGSKTLLLSYAKLERI